MQIRRNFLSAVYIFRQWISQRNVDGASMKLLWTWSMMFQCCIYQSVGRLRQLLESVLLWQSPFLFEFLFGVAINCIMFPSSIIISTQCTLSRNCIYIIYCIFFSQLWHFNSKCVWLSIDALGVDCINYWTGIWYNYNHKYYFFEHFISDDVQFQQNSI